MRKLSIAVVQALTAGVLVAVAGFAAAQPAYPSKPIRIIVPVAAGGSTSNVARLLAQKLTEAWGQQVIVENRAGGNTIIGTEAAAKSAPDGYTLLVPSNTHVIIPLLVPNLPFDAIRDFAPVATLASNKFVLLVHPSVPANTLQQFIALAKARPGQLNYGSAGSGSGGHLAGEAFIMHAGVKMQHIPYKGGAQALADLIGGQVQLSFQTPISSAPHIKSGKLKGLAISGESRLATLPQVPTFIEGGLPAYDEKSWQGVFAPAGTPKPIIDKLSAEIAKMLTAPDVKEKLDNQGVEPFISNAEQFAAMIKAETAKLVKIIKAANIKFEN